MADSRYGHPDGQLSFEDLARLALTDLDVARLFAERNSNQLISAAGSWFVWDTTRWVEDRLDVAHQRLAQLLDELVALATVSPMAGQGLRNALLRLRSAARMRSVLSVAQTLPSIRRLPEQLDATPGRLNFMNGTLDVERQQLCPHDPSDLITRRIEHPYEPYARAERWDQFVQEVTASDLGLARYLQKSLGQALLGSLRAQKAFFFLGEGANGKSVLIEAVKDAAGPYAVTIPGHVLVKGRGNQDPRNTFARLQGVRYAFVSELDEQQTLAEGTLKSITGGEEIAARVLYKDEFAFHPECTPFIATNHLPRVQGHDYGIRRRLVAIPFPVTFLPHEQDPRLLEKLRAEAPGILRWLVEGAAMYLTEGLDEPLAVRDATAEFWRQADSVTTFLRACTGTDSSSDVSAADLYTVYRTWCDEHGITPLSVRAFGDGMTRNDFSQANGRRRKNSAGNIVYGGIRLTEDAAGPVRSTSLN